MCQNNNKTIISVYMIKYKNEKNNNTFLLNENRSIVCLIIFICACIAVF